jgi:molybdenum cofactor cytidylyltransferase|tara:strand:+ start:69 stop:638 length:570 start_codon:yes stop_codon:yes gene_type:complete
MNTIGAVVMAAGSSIRFGSDKRLYDDGNGPILQQTLSHVLALNLPVCVVLRIQDQRAVGELLGRHTGHPGLACYFVSHSERGIGHSLQAFFRQPPAWDGAMIFLADMPWIKTDTSQLLLEHFDAEKIIAPQIAGQRGHPVLFPRQMFAELSQLRGDRGANALLQSSHGLVVEIAVEDQGVVLDVDSLPC